MDISFIRDHLGGRNSLRRRALFGSGWMLARHATLASIEMAKTMVFARVLDAYAYGVMALATMGVGFLESFTALGVELLVQRDNDDVRKRLDVYWTIRAARGVTLFCIAWIAAPLFAALYEKPELVAIIRFMSTAFLFDGFSGFGREVFLRNMAFGRGAAYDIATIAVATGAGIIALFMTRTVWALAVTFVLYSIARCVASYLMMPWIPHVRFDRTVARTVLTFGLSIVGMNALNFIVNNFDKAIIGTMFDLEQLGFYARANFLALLPATYLANAIAPVFLPSFRTIAQDTARLRSAFFKATTAYAVVFGLVGIGLFVFARPFVVLLYGERWLDVVPIFRILILFGTIKSIAGVCPTILVLKGKPWLMTISSGVMVALFCGLSIPLLRAYGVPGIAWALVIAGVASYALSLIFAIALLWSPAMREGAIPDDVRRPGPMVEREQE